MDKIRTLQRASLSRVFLSLSLVALAYQPSSAEAASVTVTGTTSGAPRLSRPETETEFNYPTSDVYRADAAPYAVNAFWTDLDDHFDIFSLPIGGWNNFFGLYAGSFDPAQPLRNLVFFNDDFYVNGNKGAGNQSTFDARAGVQYLAVTTGVGGASGDYSLSLGSHGKIYLGSIPAAPEPAEWAMIASGGTIVSHAARRRRRGCAGAGR